MHQDTNGDNGDDDTNTSSSSSSKQQPAEDVDTVTVWSWRDLPVDVRQHTLHHFLDQDSLLETILVSKQLKADCYTTTHDDDHPPGRRTWSEETSRIIIPTIVLNPSLSSFSSLQHQHLDVGKNYTTTTDGSRRITKFLHMLRQQQDDDNDDEDDDDNGVTTFQKLQRYRHMKVNGVQHFWQYIHGMGIMGHHDNGMIKNIIPRDTIISLDLSSSRPSVDASDLVLGQQQGNYSTAESFPILLSYLFPNLRAVDLSNTKYKDWILTSFLQNCSQLETITWHHNTDYDSSLSVVGRTMMKKQHHDDDGGTTTTLIKEIMMDYSSFYLDDEDETTARAGQELVLSDLTTPKHRDVFLFHECCDGLERVSIRDARYIKKNNNDDDDDDDDEDDRGILIPQNALIKFVRSTASLQWFRSNLTYENMELLRKERPGIQLLN